MERGDWWAAVHGVMRAGHNRETKPSSPRVRYQTTKDHPYCPSLLKLFILANPMEKAVAPHSSTLAWKIPWTGEPGGLQSMGLLRVGHN